MMMGCRVSSLNGVSDIEVGWFSGRSDSGCLTVSGTCDRGDDSIEATERDIVVGISNIY